jgi:hypothetical protein
MADMEALGGKGIPWRADGYCSDQLQGKKERFRRRKGWMKTNISCGEKCWQDVSNVWVL